MIELRVLGTLAIQSREGGLPIAAVTQPKRLALLLYLALAEPPGPQSGTAWWRSCGRKRTTIRPDIRSGTRSTGCGRR